MVTGSQSIPHDLNNESFVFHSNRKEKKRLEKNGLQHLVDAQIDESFVFHSNRKERKRLERKGFHHLIFPQMPQVDRNPQALCSRSGTILHGTQDDVVGEVDTVSKSSGVFVSSNSPATIRKEDLDEMHNQLNELYAKLQKTWLSSKKINATVLKEYLLVLGSYFSFIKEYRDSDNKDMEILTKLKEIGVFANIINQMLMGCFETDGRIANMGYPKSTLANRDLRGPMQLSFNAVKGVSIDLESLYYSLLSEMLKDEPDYSLLENKLEECFLVIKQLEKPLRVFNKHVSAFAQRMNLKRKFAAELFNTVSHSIKVQKIQAIHWHRIIAQRLHDIAAQSNNEI